MNTEPHCREWREAIRLRTCGALPNEQEIRLEAHLAACTECRRYAQEVRATIAGLQSLASPEAEPSPGFRARWTSLVEEAARPKGVSETVAPFAAWWRAWLLRNLRPAMGVAGVWLLALLFRLTAPEAPPPAQTTVARSPVQIFRVLEVEANQPLLAWHLWKQPPASAPEQKPQSVRPRSGLAPAQPAANRGPEPGSQITLPLLALHPGTPEPSAPPFLPLLS